jgi:hypothetical protein
MKPSAGSLLHQASAILVGTHVSPLQPYASDGNGPKRPQERGCSNTLGQQDASCQKCCERTAGNE